MIVAMSKNGVIGINNRLPWPKLKEDMKFFRTITIGKTVVMGRKTFESIGSKPLLGRNNIVISKNRLPYEFENLTVFNDINEVFKLDNCVIIGGSSIYEYFLPYTNIMYITIVNKHIEGDTYFPHINNYQWKIKTLKDCIENDIRYSIYEYKRHLTA